MSEVAHFSRWPEAVQIGLELMIAELEAAQLEVVLVPCRRWVCEGGYVRVAVSRNCDWYRRFCALHGSDRVRRNALHDTRIKRRAVVRVLARLIAGRPTRSKYAAELFALAERHEERAGAARNNNPTAARRAAFAL